MLVAVADVQHFGNETRRQEQVTAKRSSLLPTVLSFFPLICFAFIFFFLGHVQINVCPIQVQDTFLDLTIPRGKKNKKH